MELLERRDTTVRTALLLAPNRTAVAGFLDLAVGGVTDDGLRGPHRVAVLLRIRETSPPAAASPGMPRYVDVSSLTVGLPRFSLFGGWLDDEGDGPIMFSEAEEPVRSHIVDSEELESALRAAWGVGAEEPENRSRVAQARNVCFLPPDDELERRTRATVQRLLRTHARVLEVDLRQVSVLRAELARLGGIGAVIDPQALDTVEGDELFHVALPGFAGMRNAIGSSLSRSYIGDIEHVSGGTGFAIIEVGDIVTETIGGGLVLDIEADLVPGTPWAQLRLDGAVADYPRFQRKARHRANELVDLESAKRPKDDGSEDVATVKATGDWIDIDLPDQTADRIQHLVTLPLGKAMLLSSLPDAERPGRVRILIAGVREIEVELEVAE